MSKPKKEIHLVLQDSKEYNKSSFKEKEKIFLENNNVDTLSIFLKFKNIKIPKIFLFDFDFIWDDQNKRYYYNHLENDLYIIDEYNYRLLKMFYDSYCEESKIYNFNIFNSFSDYILDSKNVNLSNEFKNYFIEIHHNIFE